MANTKMHLIHDVTEGKILRERDIWKSLANVMNLEMELLFTFGLSI